MNAAGTGTEAVAATRREQPDRARLVIAASESGLVGPREFSG